jgi:hypothetical protein
MWRTKSKHAPHGYTDNLSFSSRWRPAVPWTKYSSSSSSLQPSQWRLKTSVKVKVTVVGRMCLEEDVTNKVLVLEWPQPCVCDVYSTMCASYLNDRNHVFVMFTQPCVWGGCDKQLNDRNHEFSLEEDVTNKVLVLEWPQPCVWGGCVFSSVRDVYSTMCVRRMWEWRLKTSVKVKVTVVL